MRNRMRWHFGRKIERKKIIKRSLKSYLTLLHQDFFIQFISIGFICYSVVVVVVVAVVAVRN